MRWGRINGKGLTYYRGLGYRASVPGWMARPTG